METKETDLNAFEVCVCKQVDEMNLLRENNQSMVSQIADNLRLEEQIVIQNGVIKELQVKT